MKKIFLSLVFCILAVNISFADFSIVGRREMGKGYYPQFKFNGTVITYSGSENVANNVSSEATNGLTVDNSDLKLNLYRNGVKTVLTPHGADVNYVWSSLSPDGTMILFNTCKGTGVCDLQGKEIINLGNLNAPVWYGSRYVVGMDDNSNGNYYTSSRLVIASIDGTLRQTLTDADEMAMYPAVNAESGHVAYNTIDGRVKVMKIAPNKNLTADDTKDIVLVDAMPPIGKVDDYDPTNQLMLKPSDVKIYINPGHGGFDSDDRNMVLYPFNAGDQDGFWESQTNLRKGLMLDSILRQLGFQTKMSRTDNGKYSDRSLSAVAAEANAWGADFMLSIHSNAGSGLSNYVLELYSGSDTDDEQTYPTAALCTQESRAIATLIADNLYKNQITTWSAEQYYVFGDKSHANKSLGWQDGYGALRGLTVPGCISEGSMHDYLPEAYRLMNDGYKYLEAWNFAKTFNAYFCNAKMPNGVVAGQVRDMYNKLMLSQVRKIRGSRDELLPIHSAMVYLMQNGQTIDSVKTDNFYNGVFVFRNVVQGDYTLKVVHSDYYSLEMPIQVVKGEITYQDMMLNKQRPDRPVVQSYVPSSSEEVDLFAPIRIDFSVDMLADSVIKAFSISPAVEGHLYLVNSQRTLVFEPENGYEVGTQYAVKISTSACHPDFNSPNHLATEFTFKFQTKKRPYLGLLMSYPADNQSDVPVNADFAFVFDKQLTSSTSAYMFEMVDDATGAKIDMSDIKLNGCVSPYGMARLRLADRLQPNKAYTLTLKSELSDIDGTHLADNYVVHFTTAAAVQSDAELLNSMDDLFVSVSQDLSSGVVKHDISVDTSIPNEGVGCNSISYQFGNSQDDILFLIPNYLNYVFTSHDTLIMDVYGDFSFNTLAIEFSIDGDVRQLELCQLDYLGWRTHVLPLAAMPDGVQYQFTGLRLQREETLLSGSGQIYIDALRRAKGMVDALQETGAEWLSVYPNPASDKVFVVGVDSDCTLQLFSVDGKLLRQCHGREMQLGDLTASAYILRISTPQGVQVKQIIKR